MSRTNAVVTASLSAHEPVGLHVTLDPELAAIFPDERAVNEALRTLARLVQPNAARALETVREVVDGREVEYKRLGQYVIAMHDLCGGLPVIKYGAQFTRINAGVVAGMLEKGDTPQVVAEDFDLPVEAVLEVQRLAAVFDYDRSYA